MRLFSRPRSIVLFVSLLGACRQMDVADSTPNQTTPAQAVEVGMWGGDSLGMDVGESGATLEFDCAHGAVDGRIALDATGHFVVEGSYFQEHGGPTSIDDKTPPVKARYEGNVTGETMDLTVTNLDTGEKIGAYMLRLGAAAHITKCL